MKIHKNSKQKILITLGIAIILIAVFYFITSVISQFTGYAVVEDNDDFRDCLKNNMVILFINSEDIVRSLNNIQANLYLDSAKVHNCNTNNKVCLDNEIITFPFWIINNNKIHNDITVSELSEYSGCKLNK